MNQYLSSSSANTRPVASAVRTKNQGHAAWIGDLANWSHALTITMTPTLSGHPPGSEEVLRRCRLFLNRVNRRWYKKRGTKQGYRIASAAFLEWGSYGIHPHVHWVLEKPPDQTSEDFESMLKHIAKTTSGIGQQIDIQRYYNPRWLAYMTNEGFEGWQHSLSYAAKYPRN